MQTGQMELRATTYIRNNAMVAARERLGVSQKDASELCRVPFNVYCDLEKLDYTTTYNEDYILRIASNLGIEPDCVFPQSMAGLKLNNKTIKTKLVDSSVLLSCATTQTRLMLQSPDEIVLNDERISEVSDLMECLSKTEKKILKLRFGLGGGKTHTLKEVGKIFKITGQCVRDYESRAIMKLQSFAKRKTNVDFFNGLTRQEMDRLFNGKQ